MKPLNFLPLFVLYFIMLIAFGALCSFEDLLNGEFAVLIFISLVAIIASMILAFLTIKIRTSETQNNKRKFNLFFIFYSLFFLTTNVFMVLNDSTRLTFARVLISFGLTFLMGFLGAKVSILSMSKKTA